MRVATSTLPGEQVSDLQIDAPSWGCISGTLPYLAWFRGRSRRLRIT